MLTSTSQNNLNKQHLELLTAKGSNRLCGYSRKEPLHCAASAKRPNEIYKLWLVGESGRHRGRADGQVYQGIWIEGQVKSASQVLLVNNKTTLNVHLALYVYFAIIIQIGS